MDVFTGAVVARYASMLAARISPSCDRLLEKLSGRQAGIRSKTRVMIGGAPITQQYAEEIGADGYTDNAGAAVALARKLSSN